jgi:putative ABC transport system ATP-binding protein
MIELQDIKVIFNQDTQLENKVLKNISFKVEEGDFVTIIGGNGAGKSTLMNVLSGDIMPNNGKVIIDNQDVTGFSIERRSGMVARIFQDPMIGTFSGLTIEENMSIAFKRGKNRSWKHSLTNELREKFREALSEINMGLEMRLKDEVASLSGGQRQALSLVMATIQNCKILLLDEHTAALDPKIAKVILNLTKKIIERHKLTALMITHSMNQALEYGNRTIMMYHGKIVRDMYGKARNKLSPDDLVKYFDL